MAAISTSPLGTDSDSDGCGAGRTQDHTPPVKRPYKKQVARVGFNTGGCRLDSRALLEVETG